MEKRNYAFIDAQNLNSGLTKLGWKIDWKRFRTYLAEERNVEVAYVFIGFVPDNQDLYLVLQKAGFVVVFKEVYTTASGDVKGNVDAELILQAMADYDRYDQAVIVSGDGDFTCLLRYLEQNGKFLAVIAPYEKSLSSLISRAAGNKVEYLRSLRKKVEYRYAGQGRTRNRPKPPTDPMVLPIRTVSDSLVFAKETPSEPSRPSRRRPDRRRRPNPNQNPTADMSASIFPN